MGIVASAKVSFVRNALDRMTHGDTGSTALGAVAASLLVATDLHFDRFFSDDPNIWMPEAGKAAGIVGLAIWGYYIGKKGAGGRADNNPS